MRKKYQKPHIEQVLLQGQVPLMSVSSQNEVNSYQKGIDLKAGDDDE